MTFEPVKERGSKVTCQGFGPAGIGAHRMVRSSAVAAALRRAASPRPHPASGRSRDPCGGAGYRYRL